MKKTRRTRIEIITEILKVCCNGGVNKTKIVYSTNLNFKITDNYLKSLVNKGYIIAGETYQISESGRDFLNKITEIQTSLNDDKQLLNSDKQLLNGDKQSLNGGKQSNNK